MTDKISVIIKEVGKPSKRKTIDNALKAMQDIVGGQVEAVTLTNNIVLLANGDGIPLGLPYNCEFMRHHIFGTMILVGTDGEDFCSFPYEIEV